MEEQKEGSDLIAKTEEENKRLEEALKKREELLEKQTALSARDKVGGTAEAGKPMKTEDDLVKEKIEAQADRIYGSLYDLKKRRR